MRRSVVRVDYETGIKMTEELRNLVAKAQDSGIETREELESFLGKIQRSAIFLGRTCKIGLRQGCRSLEAVVSERVIQGVKDNRDGTPKRFFSEEQIYGFFLF